VPEASEEFGAVAVNGVVTYDLLSHDSEHLELKNLLRPEERILIHVEALAGLISILNKAQQQISLRK
jgi:hypothetical protein